jgi:hypothetical protein
MSSHKNRVLAALLAGSALGGLHTAQADTFNVTLDTWGSVGTLGSFAWAIDQANTSTATNNVISIAPGLTINVDNATATGSPSNLATISRSVAIQGNGATLVGNPEFVTTGAQVVTKANPQAPVGSDIVTTPSYSLFKVGTFGQANAGLAVNITNLNADGLNRIAQINQGAAFSYTGGTIVNSVNFTGTPTGPSFEAYGAALALSNLTINRAFGFNAPIGTAFGGVISAEDSTLNLANSTIRNASNLGAVSLVGGTANIVSTVVTGSGGLSVTGGSTIATGTMNVVNSLVFMQGQVNGGGDGTLAINRVIAGTGGTMILTASSVLVDALSLSGSASLLNGVPLDADGGAINLVSSAVMGTQIQDTPPQIAYQASNGGSMTADVYSWVRPMGGQTAADLRTLFNQPGLLTGSPGYAITVLNTDPLIEMIAPYPGEAYPVDGGVLINVVTDANGANQLLSPIDGTPILTDVFGNARTRLGLRDVGAVQGIPEPSTMLGLLTGLAALLGVGRRRSIA